ncbi:MAG: DivIVA domain-containing protein [Acidobacteria bacterium]|nr:DivIVA domain-containing protein [Acidobacteriota bacterium]
MALMPLDIEGRQFKREMLGYSRQEVHEFLQAAADSLSRANLEREEALRQYATAREEVEEFRRRERSLIEALASAERLAEERRQMAHSEAERIIAEARYHAEQILARTRLEVTRVEQHIMRLRAERESFENRLSGLLDEHRRLLDVRRQEALVADKLRARSSLPPAATSTEHHE